MRHETALSHTSRVEDKARPSIADAYDSQCVPDRTEAGERLLQTVGPRFEEIEVEIEA